MKLETQELARQSCLPFEDEENLYLDQFLQILRTSAEDLAQLIKQQPYDPRKYSRIANLLHALRGKVPYLLRTRTGERYRRSEALAELIDLLEHELIVLEAAKQKVTAIPEEKLKHSVLGMKSILSSYLDLAASF